uniref:Cyclin-dependent kinase 2-interacting protein n=2 Tax=Anopheles triannulatus TaxID=58253 RepID=A0A2M4AY18_9DIPT
MSITPERHHHTVRLKSPRTPTQDSPGTVACLRINELVAGVVEHNRKWISAVEKGSQFCSAIKNTLKDTLQSTGQSPYPENVSVYCNKLAILVTILADVLSNAENSLARLKLLAHVLEENEIVGTTWNMNRIASALEAIVASYKQEIDTRKHISENIAHSLTVEELLLYVCTWNSIMNVERDRELLFRMVMYEFGLTE